MMFGRGKISTVKTSIAMGKSRSYLSNHITYNLGMRVDTFANLCDAIGYDLVMRNQETGNEIIVTHDDSEKKGNNMRFDDFCKQHINDRLNDYEGCEFEAADLAFELTLDENNNGVVFSSTDKAKRFIKTNFDAAAMTFDYYKSELDMTINPFADADVFSFYMLHFGVNQLINQCNFIQEHWDDEIELDRATIDTICQQVSDGKIDW